MGLYFTPPKTSFWKFTCKRAYSLLLPYLVFATVSVMIFAVLGKFATSSLGAEMSGGGVFSDLLDMLTGVCRANRPIWFLPCFFVFCLLCFWIMKLTEGRTVLVTNVIMLAVAVISVLLCFVNEQTLKIDGVFWKADAAIFMLAFFCSCGDIHRRMLDCRAVFGEISSLFYRKTDKKEKAGVNLHL